MYKSAPKKKKHDLVSIFIQLYQAQLNLGKERFRALVSNIDESILRDLMEYKINLLD